ncbi:GNAT family N-acetyltransferase [Rhizohabitans arisaemae]|uniref:GNAT family N-acetyltransferase n=1 Tax=Rhizohabitans arisaemae TaxID=2720610 RepID=UPI0024B0AA1C|nr:GNAT family N-acetyltransferase [Rhizohabitans arisaemae]
MNSYPIRPVQAEEWPAFAAVDVEAFNIEGDETEGALFSAMQEFDRTLVAFDGSAPVGGTALYSLRMAVPGGVREVAGVTAVAVDPSHRRRGILRSLMTRQLTDLHEGGEAVAALYASESPIYRRYGYGVASHELSYRIPTRGSTAYVRDAPDDPGLRVRLLRPGKVDEARQDLAKVHAEAVPLRPGRYERTEARWNSRLSDGESRRRGSGPLRGVIVEDATGPRGYALFRIKDGWDSHGVPDCELTLVDLVALDPAAYAVTWRQLLDRDLVSTVVAQGPVDDPLTRLLAEPRHLHSTWSDELWVRLVDVDRALGMRAYAAPVDVVIDVTDPVCPWNERRFRLSGDRSGGTCTPTGDPADLTVPVQALGSAYLGGESLGSYHTAGLVSEHRPGAVAHLSTAMSWGVKPHCGLMF